jgi:hypothetical protein
MGSFGDIQHLWMERMSESKATDKVDFSIFVLRFEC